MTDSEHEEWLRDRADQKNPAKKRIIVGGLQTDAPGEEDKTEHANSAEQDEEDDDEDESQSDNSENDDAPGE